MLGDVHPSPSAGYDQPEQNYAWASRRLALCGMLCDPNPAESVLGRLQAVRDTLLTL